MSDTSVVFDASEVEAFLKAIATARTFADLNRQDARRASAYRINGFGAVVNAMLARAIVARRRELGGESAA
jgi:hypothetical protein